MPVPMLFSPEPDLQAFFRSEAIVDDVACANNTRVARDRLREDQIYVTCSQWYQIPTSNNHSKLYPTCRSANYRLTIEGGS